jgi:hypothetical protein
MESQLLALQTRCFGVVNDVLASSSGSVILYTLSQVDYFILQFTLMSSAAKSVIVLIMSDTTPN